MGASYIELDKPASPMESEEGTAKDLMTNSSLSIEKVHHDTSNNPSSSISSSPDSTLDDHICDLNKNSDETISGNFVSKYELSDNGSSCATSLAAFTSQMPPANVSATQSPSPQVMERPAALPGASSYRIPSSVFDRSKSSTPMEWSVCSNESLFSIHTGNMSFRNDPFFLRSGELGPPGEVSTSGQMFNYSTVQASGTEPKSHEFGVVEASIKEVIRESEDQKNESWMPEEIMSRRSRESRTSAKSFAFPILIGDIDHCASERTASSVKVAPEQQESQAQQTQKQEPESSAQPKPKTSSETEKPAPSKWFSWFKCCSFC
ncbi:Hypothetical predicted protein [Olea europaea subsp. europaea]|uniref:Uncharacterized protein n=2 Tax=Olea europaea subsp. europaea TaxID=158383 RepID=A0A8S0RFV0_OLEEU|nr:Hypothetical predicted protein [Olea europaea subsp. europaea]